MVIEFFTTSPSHLTTVLIQASAPVARGLGEKTSGESRSGATLAICSAAFHQPAGHAAGMPNEATR
jgi:hypothetical protein